VLADMSSISSTVRAQNRLAQEDHCLLSSLNLAIVGDDKETIFRVRLGRFLQLARIGQWADAQAIWDLLDPMGRNWSRTIYRPGDAEYSYAQFRFWRGDLSEGHLAHAEQLALAGKNRGVVRLLHRLRGQWCLERCEWSLAAESLHEAVSMARAIGQIDELAETRLALARFHLGQLADPRREAGRLANARWSHSALGELWLAIGDREQATQHALAAYKWAWADGEPYVHRYGLNKARALLEKLGAEVPNLPPYDPARDEKLPWEDEVAAAIEKLRAEKEAKNRNGD
jgi:tetratricopeptide (TPR) repeat protein